MGIERRPIVFVMPTGDFRGGAERMLRNVAVGLYQRSVPACYIFLSDGPLYQELLGMDFDVKLIHAGRVREVGTYISTLRQISKVIKGLNPVLIIDWMLKGRLYGGVVGMLRRVPTGIWLHDFDGNRFLDKLAYAIPIQEVWASSQAIAVKSKWGSRINRIPSVVHPGVEITTFRKMLDSRHRLRQQLGIPESSFVVGTVARLVRWKGIDKAIATMHYVPDAHLIVVGGDHFGEPEYPVELSHLVKQLGLEHRVHFVGHRTNVHEWMNAFDVFLHLTTRPNPADQVIKEAMACGVTVVASRSGYTEEVITNMEDGLLIDSLDPTVIADTISVLQGDSSLRQRVGQCASTRITETFSIDAMVDNFLHSLESRTALNA